MNDNFTRMNKARQYEQAAARARRTVLPVIAAVALVLALVLTISKATANTAHMAANWADVVHVYALEGKQ